MRVFSVYLLLAQAAAVMGVPDKPDFSGRWVLVASQPGEGADAARALTVSQSVRRTDFRGEAMSPYYDEIAIQRESTGGVTYESHLLCMVSGTVRGVNSNGTSRGGPSTHEAVTWRDSSLVFERGAYTGMTPGTGEWTERRETWTLEPSGELKITIATSGSAEPPRTVTATYVRQRTEGTFAANWVRTQ
jgi:hypothetical protein